eukprot:EG_transcript_21559
MAKRNRSKAAQSPPSLTLLVANLPLNCSEQDVFHLFRPFGPIQWLRLVRPRPLCAGRSSALVRFASLGHALAAKEAMHRRSVEGNTLLDVTFGAPLEDHAAHKATSRSPATGSPRLTPTALPSSSSSALQPYFPPPLPRRWSA